MSSALRRLPLEQHDPRFGQVCLRHGLSPAGGVIVEEVGADRLVILRQELLQKLQELRRAARLDQPTAVDTDQYHHRWQVLLELTSRLLLIDFSQGRGNHQGVGYDEARGAEALRVIKNLRSEERRVGKECR